MRLLKLLCVGALLCSSFSPTIAYMDDTTAIVHTEEAAADPQAEEIEQTNEAIPTEEAIEEPVAVETEPPPAAESAAAETEPPSVEEAPAAETEEPPPPPIPENLPDASGILQEIAEGPSSRFFLNDHLRRQKRNHAESTYIEGVLRRAFANFPIMELSTNVGATATRTIHFPTHSFHNAGMNSWVSEIAGVAGMGTPWFTHIYYGDHPDFRGIYQSEFIMEGVRALTSGVGGSTAEGGIQVDYSLVRTGLTMGLTVTLRRIRAWDPNRHPEEWSRAVVDRLALGATVATHHPPPHDSNPIRLTNELDTFTNVEIGSLRIRNVAPPMEVRVMTDTIPLLLGTPASEWRSKDFLSQYLQVRVGGRILTPEEYDLAMVNPAEITEAAGRPHNTTFRITSRDNQAAPTEVDLPFVVEWGDSVVFGGAEALTERPAAAFTLHHGTRPRIIAAYGRAPGAIHPGWAGEYYDFGFFSMTGWANRNLSQTTANQRVTARGVEPETVLHNRWTNREANYGDVVRTWVADPTKNALRTPTSNEFIHHGGETFYELTSSGYRPLNINRAVIEEQEIPRWTTLEELRRRVSEFIDVSNLPNVRVSNFVSFPDTSQLGSSTGVITVSETLQSGRTVSYDYTVPFRVANVLDVQVEEIPVPLGTTIDDVMNMELNPYLEVTLNGQVLSPNQYEVTFVNQTLDTMGVGVPDQRPTIRVRSVAGGVTGNVTPVELMLPIVVEWGDSVVFGGDGELTRQTVAAFTLHHGTHPRITAAMGNTGGTAFIHRDFADTYYDFSWFSMTNWADNRLLFDPTGSHNVPPEQSVTARGLEFRNVLFDRWTNREVAYGDVVRAWVADPAKNVLRRPASNSFLHHGNEVYYEVTPSGYRPLNLNRVVPTERQINRGITVAELQRRVSEFINVSNLPNVRAVEFVSFPDASQAGRSEGIIRVAETLESGKTVSYNYRVPFNVTLAFNVQVEEIPVPLGTTIADVMNMDLSSYLEVTLDGQVLSPNQYEVTFVSMNGSFDARVVGVPPRRPTFRVRYLDEDEPRSVSVVLPIVVEWGDSVVFGGDGELSERTVAAFTLHHGARPRITAAWGNGGTNDFIINRDFSSRYYEFGLYPMTGLPNRNLSQSTASHFARASGTENRAILFSRWTNREVVYGDVVRTWVADPAKNVLRRPASNEFLHYGGETFYEVTTSGYRPLNINRVVTEVQEIPRGMTQEELQNRVAEFVDVSNLPNVQVSNFVSFPNTSQLGSSTGTINVRETLESGSTVTYTYTVRFNVITPTIIDVSLPKEIVFGSTDLYDGEVVSPVYMIENNGTSDVRVNVQAVDVTSNDSNLALLRSSDEDPAGTTDAVRLVMNAAANAVDLNEVTSNQLLADISPSQAAQFTIGGNFFGEYGETMRLGIDIHYRFEILP
jgi:hypothetical protein